MLTLAGLPGHHVWKELPRIYLYFGWETESFSNIMMDQNEHSQFLDQSQKLKNAGRMVMKITQSNTLYNE